MKLGELIDDIRAHDRLEQRLRDHKEWVHVYELRGDGNGMDYQIQQVEKIKAELMNFREMEVA